MLSLSDDTWSHTWPVYANSRACFKPRLVTPCKFTSSAPLSTIQRLNIAWGGREWERWGVTELTKWENKTKSERDEERKTPYRLKIDFGVWNASTKSYCKSPCCLNSTWHCTPCTRGPTESHGSSLGWLLRLTRWFVPCPNTNKLTVICTPVTSLI